MTRGFHFKATPESVRAFYKVTKWGYWRWKKIWFPLIISALTPYKHCCLKGHLSTNQKDLNTSNIQQYLLICLCAQYVQCAYGLFFANMNIYISVLYLLCAANLIRTEVWKADVLTSYLWPLKQTVFHYSIWLQSPTKPRSPPCP